MDKINKIFMNKSKRGFLIVEILFILRDILGNCSIVRKLIGFFLEKTKMVKNKKINYKPIIRISYCFWWSSSTL